MSAKETTLVIQQARHSTDCRSHAVPGCTNAADADNPAVVGPSRRGTGRRRPMDYLAPRRHTMRWRNLIAWMLLLALYGSLSGCGGPESGRNPKDNTTDITSEEAP